MLEMAASGEQQSQAGGIRRCDHCRIALRSTRLDHGRYARCRQRLDTVGEWEEGIARRHAADRPLPCLTDGSFRSPYPALISGSNPDRKTVAGNDDGIGFRVGGDPPGKPEIA